MHLSVIVPAYNEERYLVATLAGIQEAGNRFQVLHPDNAVEVLVVDNDSEDRTAELAVQQGCRVVRELEHNIAKVRNTGAREAAGDILIFIDADTLIPAELFELIAARMSDPACVGGAVDVCHKPSKRFVRIYLRLWRFVGTLTGMAQGATQFCRKTDFREFGGYDESLFMSEGVDFFWKMNRYARNASRHTAYIDQARVIPSPRKYDQWPIWKTLTMTNPIFILLFRKTRAAWPGWYGKRPK